MPYEGRAEVYYDNAWGSICGNSFPIINVAIVICRQLRLPYGAVETVTYRLSEFGQVIWLEDIKCTGLEDYLSGCRHGSWVRRSHTYEQCLGVICKDGRRYVVCK